MINVVCGRRCTPTLLSWPLLYHTLQYNIDPWYNVSYYFLNITHQSRNLKSYTRGNNAAANSYGTMPAITFISKWVRPSPLCPSSQNLPREDWRGTGSKTLARTFQQLEVKLKIEPALSCNLTRFD